MALPLLFISPGNTQFPRQVLGVDKYLIFLLILAPPTNLTQVCHEHECRVFHKQTVARQGSVVFCVRKSSEVERE
jgi:hypothetical protein